MHRLRLRSQNGQENVNLFRTKSQSEATLPTTRRGALADRSNVATLKPPVVDDPELRKRAPKHAVIADQTTTSSASSDAISSHTRSHDRSNAPAVAQETSSHLYDDKPKPSIDVVVFAEEYAADINTYLLKLQSSYTVAPKHLSLTNFDSKISARHRAMLVDWVVHASAKCNYQLETILLAIQTLDRYLQCTKIPRENLQIVSVAALWLTAKYEEVVLPDPEDLLYYSGGDISMKTLIASEYDILRALNFRLNAPLPAHFLRMYTRATPSDGSSAHNLAKYFILTAQLEYACASIRPSDLAAGAVWLSRTLLNLREAWPKQLAHLSMMSEKQASEVGRLIVPIVIKVQTGKTTLLTIQKYFTKPENRSVANHKCLSMDNLKRVVSHH